MSRYIETVVRQKFEKLASRLEIYGFIEVRMDTHLRYMSDGRVRNWVDVFGRDTPEKRKRMMLAANATWEELNKMRIK
mgnify:CR=1 FL=1